MIFSIQAYKRLLTRSRAESVKSSESISQAIFSRCGSRSRICHLSSLVVNLWPHSRLRRQESTRVQPTCSSAKIVNFWIYHRPASSCLACPMRPFTRSRSITMCLRSFRSSSKTLSLTQFSPTKPVALSPTTFLRPLNIQSLNRDKRASSRMEPEVPDAVGHGRAPTTLEPMAMRAMTSKEGAPLGITPRMKMEAMIRTILTTMVEEAKMRLRKT